MTTEELKSKYEELLKCFNGKHIIKPSIHNLIHFFKDRYVDVLLEGRKCIVDLETARKSSHEYREKFKEDIQQITIVYRRLNVVFFTWDAYPQYGEEYFIIDGSTLWCKYIYPKQILLSEIFEKKIISLKDNQEELRLQISLIEFDNFDGRIEIDNDLEHLMIK